MDKKDFEHYFTYKQLQSFNAELRSRVNHLTLNYNILLKKQDSIIKKEVKARTKQLEHKHSSELKAKDCIINDKDQQIDSLKREVAKLTAVLNNNASNSGIPTSKTPIGKLKHIPNSRVKSDKKIGGQKGHKKHKLKRFEDDEITEHVSVTPKHCPKCLSNKITILDNAVTKDETDYIVDVIKRRYTFNDCQCKDCSKEFRANIPNNLKEENQYGTTVQSLAVCLNNEIYTPFNKVVKLVSGITDNQINMSEGYVAKLQRRASNNLNKFINDATNYFPKQNCYGWDDGVISINSKNAYLRIYCTEKVSLFFAHESKNKETLAEDGILEKTSISTTVMHDHLLYNYNDLFNYENVECLSHLLRRVKKMELNTKHDWCTKLKELLSTANSERNDLVEQGIQEFSKTYLEKLSLKYDELLKLGYSENEEDSNNYFFAEEISFLKDLAKYKDSYLKWCYDFELPSTNNNAERNLRPVKSKMKISGHFKNIKTARYYARIRSYIETCKRNGINIIDATSRLMEGNPYTLDEILNYQKND